MAKADLRVVGPQASFGRYVVAAGTAIQAGEPLHNLGSQSSGVASVNTFVLAAADTPVVGTHRFGGVALKASANAAAGTTLTQYLITANPVPHIGQIRGKAETAANVDTASELAGLIGDYVLIDYAATGAADGGELYTVKDAASADTSGLEIVGGNTAIQYLHVSILPNAYRHDFA